nr:hypothetical protein [uncultured Albidiferax sp.]
MKVAPVSADLLIKLTLIAAAVAGIWYVGKKATDTVAAAWEPLSNAVISVGEYASEIAPYVTPWNPQNIVYQGVGSVGGAIVSPTGPGRNADGSWTLGGWLYDINPFEPKYKP